MKYLHALILLALCAFSSACSNPGPSDAIVQEYLRDTVNSLDMYHRNFEIVSIERVDGWKANDDYEVEVNVHLASKVDYLEVIDQLADQILDEGRTDKTVAMGINLARMQRRATGEDLKFLEFYAEKAEQQKIPPSLQSKRAGMEVDEYDGIVQRADQLLSDNFGLLFGRTLTKGDALNVTYTLTFRPTEKGWKGIAAR